MGRPPLPKGSAKATLLSVRFTAEERAAINAAAERAALTVSDWARRVLLDNAAEVSHVDRYGSSTG